jgi:hypothetical protein
MYKAIVDDLEARTINMTSGGAFATEGRSTQENYAYQVGYCEALRAVLEKGRQIEVLMHGGEPSNE